MHQDSHSFCFVVDGEPTRLSEVTVGSSYSIDELKEAIREKLHLEMVPTSQIILWKVRSCYNWSTSQELIRFIAEHANTSYP